MSFLAPAAAHMRPVRQRAVASAVAGLPEPATAHARILAVWGEANLAERHDGARWYPTALRIAGQVSDACGHLGEPAYGAGLIAALSPQCSWDENIIRAFAAAEGSEQSWFSDHDWKVRAILAGADPDAVLGGRKVRSFYRNILGSSDAVTVDRHAVAVAFGRPLVGSEVKILERPGAYVYVAGCYRSAARSLGVPTSELQATVWLAWRRLKGDADLGDF